MANPALDKEFGELPAVTDATLDQPPASPISSDSERMTIGGTSAKTGFFLLLVLVLVCAYRRGTAREHFCLHGLR